MLMPSWVKTATKEQLERDMGDGFKIRVGWTKTRTDTFYCEEIPTVCPTPIFRVYIWNATDIRLKLFKALGMPVYKE